MQKKDPILAAFLSLLFPALGYIYLRSWARLGVVLFVALPVGGYIFRPFIGSYYIGFFWFVAVVDVYIAAKRHNERLAAADATEAGTEGPPPEDELP